MIQMRQHTSRELLPMKSLSGGLVSELPRLEWCVLTALECIADGRSALEHRPTDAKAYLRQV